MSHLDPSTLAQYNSLIDPHLQSYFSNERIQSHLKHAGLVSGRGEIISDGEYRTRLARREHKKHVRHVLAENIVNRAVDMERSRQAQIKRQFEIVSKAALVNNIKESRRRSENFFGPMSTSADMTLLGLDSTWSPARPKSANHQNEISDVQTRIPRIQSAYANGSQRGKSLSKTRNHRRSLRRSKSRSSSTQNSRSPNKYPDSSSHPCQITMVYYGPKIQVDYDHLVFEPIDEIMVMQQHCGGENIIAFKANLKPGAEFTFDSRRHSDYTFGLTLYVKGFIDSRISTCCEYKHRHGVRLGGDRGHFAIISVKGSKPCLKCQFAKQVRLKRYARSPKDNDDENKKPITISLPVADEPKMIQPPIQIPVRRISISNGNSSEDVDGSDKRKHSVRDGYSTDSSINQRKPKSKDLTPKIPKRVSPIFPKEKIQKKTWQIIFHTSNIPEGKNILVKFSFLANNQQDETENYEINIKQFKKSSTSDGQYSFSVKLKNIGKPEQIRFKIYSTEYDDDDDEEKNIKWNLDHIELIDPETNSHLIFPCKQVIRLSQEKILRLSKESSRNERRRKNSSSTNDSRPSSSNHKTRQPSPKFEQKVKTSARSSTSTSTSSTLSKHSPTKFNSTRRISSDNQSEQSTPRNDNNYQENKTRYRVTIYPSNDDDGDFNPNQNSRIFLRLNHQTRETNLTRQTDQLCPTFESGEKQTFEMDFIENTHERPTKITIGYVNSDITAMKWKLQKVVLTNLRTGDERIFPCKQILSRDESNFRAEKTFGIQSNQSDDDELTPRNQKIDSPKSDDHEEQLQTSKKQRTHLNNIHKKNDDTDDDEEQISTPKNQQTNGYNKQKSSSFEKMNDDDDEEEKQRTSVNNTFKSASLEKMTDNDDEEQPPTPTPKTEQTNGFNKQRSPSFQSMKDDEADYKKIFRKLDRDGRLEIGSPPHSPTPRPKTRRGRQDQTDEEYPTQPVAPLIGLDDLADQTVRSNDQQNPNSLPSTTTNNTENRFKQSSKSTDDDDFDN